MSQIAVAVLLVFVRHLMTTQDGSPKTYKVGDKVDKEKFLSDNDRSVYGYAKAERYFREERQGEALTPKPEQLTPPRDPAEDPEDEDLGKAATFASSSVLLDDVPPAPADEGTDKSTTGVKVENIVPLTGDGLGSGHVEDETKIKDPQSETAPATFNGTQEPEHKVEGLKVEQESIGNPNNAVEDIPLADLKEAASISEKEIEAGASPTVVPVDSLPEIAKATEDKAAKPAPSKPTPKPAPAKEKPAPFK